MRYTAGYTKWDHKRNEDVMEELQLEPVINHVKHYRNNWINHLHRMRRDRIPKVILHYRPNGKRSLGRPKKRWIENSISQKMFQMVTIHINAHSKAFPKRPYDMSGMLLAEWTHKHVECVAACRLVLSECSGTHCPLQFSTGRSRVATGPENLQATLMHPDTQASSNLRYSRQQVVECLELTLRLASPGDPVAESTNF
ncbi:hypothetical protein ANN_00369 [Periplaneta americana]|uniref:Uncharacterized protein n=1 Tax=Periplaneta americana TaxID=6978 RepID=A0ABQ8TQR1_PERAM|nr:hypothetical protein ANN_00369 [Periplaneta americana]